MNNARGVVNQGWVAESAKLRVGSRPWHIMLKDSAIMLCSKNHYVSWS